MAYIFLAGIHGVGKSTLANKLKKSLDINTFSVSDLIRKSGKSLDTITKNTTDISHNQELWKNELIKLNKRGSILLLDGHFCLLDINKNIFCLPFSTFKDTHMTKIILVENDPKITRERLLNRDNCDYSIELLEKFQDYEKQQAIKYSQENDLKIFFYNQDQLYSELLDFIIS
ncbi:ATP-binding protein [Bacillus paralicheniformis]|uniref:ATP-binding protein n=1 Tax=Bacillus paralicheniformis TaxID=1648923 RepID=UPI0011BE8A26|nr:ATP-binding protein [Bacillus paralicheniformis]MEC2209118.1 ATP-binding protein [Bacillus paralicheniformis]